MLGFITSRDQYDASFYPEDGWSLECDGHTIWIIKGNERHESITTANAIDIWLSQGRVLEMIS